MARQPEYDHKKWQQEWEENQQFMDSIAQYPRDWWKEEGAEEEVKNNPCCAL